MQGTKHTTSSFKASSIRTGLGARAMACGLPQQDKDREAYCVLLVAVGAGHTPTLSGTHSTTQLIHGGAETDSAPRRLPLEAPDQEWAESL